MALKIDTKLEGKLTCASKTDMRNLEIFTRGHSKFWKVRLSLGSFIQNPKIHELKIYRGVLCHQDKEWCKNSKLTWRIWWFYNRAYENLKNLHFNGLFLTKVYNVWTKKST